MRRVGVFGSYGRGTAGVGSDVDLLLVEADGRGPQHQRLRHLKQRLASVGSLALG